MYSHHSLPSPVLKIEGSVCRSEHAAENSRRRLADEGARSYSQLQVDMIVMLMSPVQGRKCCKLE